MPGYSGMLTNLKLIKMKILYRTFLSITAIALLTLTSCLDDEGLGVEVTRYDEVPAVVDFNEVPNSSGFITRSFSGTTDPAFAQEATFTVNLSSPYQLDKDLTVTVEYDQDAIDAFVADNAGWTGLAPSKQDFTTANVVIPAGEREATFTVNFYAEGLSADDKIISAYTITAVSDPGVIISGNFGTQFVRVVVSNVYEGWYDMVIDYYHPNAGAWPTNLYRHYEYSKYLSTVSSTKSRFDFAIWNYDAWVDVQPDNSVLFSAIFSTYDVVMENSEEPGTEILSYDPVTRTFTLVYEYAGSGGFRHFYETLTWSADQDQ